MDYSKYFKMMSKGAAAFLCTISLWSAPAKVQASCCEDTCCDGGWWGSGAGRTALIIGGAAVVGGIAGAIAGNSSNHHGKRGHRGSSGDPGATGATGATGAQGPQGIQGPPGPSTFVADVGQSLTFGQSLSLVASLIGTAEITPFVERPDGVVVEGSTVQLSIMNVPVLAPITIDNPIYGTYHFGIRVASSDLIAVGLNLTGLVFASRDSSLTSTGVEPVVDINFVQLGNQSQTTLEFTYSPDSIP